MEQRRFKLTTTDGGWFRKPTLELSTVKLPVYVDNEKYETCLFSVGGDSHIVARYEFLDEAVLGHASYSARYGLTNVVGVLNGTSILNSKARQANVSVGAFYQRRVSNRLN